jgi:hypothetical protein
MATDNDKLSEMLERYRKASDACATLYDEAANDIRFVVVPGAQWDQALKSRRKNRPCYEFPKLQAHVRQVVNSMRQTRPQGKVRGVEESDEGLAEIMNGLCRNILDVSNADLAHDIAFEKAVQGGFGCWRICTDYDGDDGFEQTITIKPVRNPFAVRFDSAAVNIDRRDARFAFVEEWIAKSEFERKYPKADLHSFEGKTNARDWLDAEKVRIAEYWYKQPIKRTLLALSTGQTVWQDETDVDALQAAGIQIVKTRAVDSHKVYSRLTNGAEWLTDPQEFPSKFIPIVPTWGQIDNVDDEEYWQGLVRQSKDQQRLHNVHRTALVEAVAKSPKAPFITKLKWIKGLENFWKNANSEDYPYLPVNDDADAMPKRAEQAEVPTALIQLAGMDNDDIKAATGIYDPSLGSQSQETSGVAIARRQSQSAVSTFNYTDNLAYAIRFEYEILIDMIPRVYDTPRVVRILGEDGAAEWKQLYQQVQDPQTGQVSTVNDISKGKYDVTVTVGPSYPTQRMEAVTAFSQLVGQIGPSFPPLAMLLAYQVVKNMDLPGNEEVAEATRGMLVKQGLLQPNQEEQQQAQQAQQQQQPNPMQQAQAAKLQADAQYTAARAQKAQAEAQAVLPKAHAQIEKDLAQAGHHQTDDALALADHAHANAEPDWWHVKAQPPPPDGIDTNFQQPPQGGF